jgi:hypothetical protein
VPSTRLRQGGRRLATHPARARPPSIGPGSRYAPWPARGVGLAKACTALLCPAGRSGPSCRGREPEDPQPDRTGVSRGAGPGWVRTVSGTAGPRWARAVNVGESASQVRGGSPSRPRTAKQPDAGFEPLSLNHEDGHTGPRQPCPVVP